MDLERCLPSPPKIILDEAFLAHPHLPYLGPLAKKKTWNTRETVLNADIPGVAWVRRGTRTKT